MQIPLEPESREIPSSPDQMAVYTAFLIPEEAMCQVKTLISHDFRSIAGADCHMMPSQAGCYKKCAIARR
jgi:hypothetical protein